jgi:hypothetical protein
MIEKIYINLELAVDLRDAAAPPPGKGEIRTSIDHGDGVATLVIPSIGSETADLTAQTVNDLRSLTHLGAIYALVPLEDSAAPYLSEALEQTGFVFSGVGPWMIDGTDALRLQLLLTPIDMSLLTIDGEFGRELVDYVRTFVS